MCALSVSMNAGVGWGNHSIVKRSTKGPERVADAWDVLEVGGKDPP